VLPITGFSPGIGHMGSQEPDDPHAMVLHHFGMSFTSTLTDRGQLETRSGEINWQDRCPDGLTVKLFTWQDYGVHNGE
jgi:hypothetical protein